MGKMPPAPWSRSCRSCRVAATSRQAKGVQVTMTTKSKRKAAMLSVVGYHACLCCWPGGVRWQQDRDHVPIRAQQRRRSRGYAL